jgi:hypothetical protein
MDHYEKYTEKLRKQARFPTPMLRVLEQYVTLGESHFHADLIQAKRQIYPPDSSEDGKRRADLIRDIETDIREYSIIRDKLMGVIHDIRIDPRNVSNPFAQHLFVHILRGSGFCERYTEDIHYGLEEINGGRWET